MANFGPEDVFPPSSSTPCRDIKTDVSRRHFIEQAAVGGAALVAWSHSAEAEMAQAQVNQPDEAAAPRTVPIHLRVNGRRHDLQLAPNVTLLDALRHVLDLTGTKKGCDHGQCGSCTVLANGKRINSCLTLAVMQDGAEITTIEGLADGETLHPVQQAFVEHDAFQCGYCTSGQICSAVGLIGEGRAKSADEIRELMSGNICRCGAYPNIVAAIEEAIGAGKDDGKR